ncbi:crotonyl-CoA carboxylase/reductase [Saccharopolyspora indica]|uniref:crotonyl-CoA carboxylase/reductase n=1 Tax=Saccharopolyspora indica TaxID=1229659 RepID=UPI0022EB03DB|nr:crotonyl-CoA carboxylase/reductase [Saccharopolyspora indica]MDA3647925.1 crotonyl-CoA carboxylase/reductase [Saccharopolyspora indica]
MDALAAAALDGADAKELESHPVPTEYLAVHTGIEDIGMFGGAEDKDVRKSLRVGRVPMPELAPDEVLVAVMASSVNYNTVWSATFEPVPTFSFLRQYGKRGWWERRHDQPYHVLGSDAAGVVVRTGSGVRRWQLGDHVLVSPIQLDDQEPMTQADGMLGEGQRAWGYETNFGGLAHYAVVRASQLIPKPGHLSWEEAASIPACGGTAYRMLIGDRGARMKLGDVVLIWGAAGGLGVYAVQLVKQAGGIAVGVVGSEEKAERVRALGCDVVINRTELGIGDDTGDDPAAVIEAGKRIGAIIRRETGEDPHIVFEYVGQATFGISMFVARRGGVVVTCGSSTGYQHQYDNRYLWMKLKRLIGSHAGNLQEMWECVRLADQGRIVPALSTVHPIEDIGEAARLVQTNGHTGKVGVLCLAPMRGLGITDPEKRASIGEHRLAPLGMG